VPYPLKEKIEKAEAKKGKEDEAERAGALCRKNA